MNGKYDEFSYFLLFSTNRCAFCGKIVTNLYCILYMQNSICNLYLHFSFVSSPTKAPLVSMFVNNEHSIYSQLCVNEFFVLFSHSSVTNYMKLLELKTTCVVANPNKKDSTICSNCFLFSHEKI